MGPRRFRTPSTQFQLEEMYHLMLTTNSPDQYKDADRTTAVSTVIDPVITRPVSYTHLTLPTILRV